MFRKKYTPPCFEKNYDCFRAEIPEWIEQAYKEMSDDIKYQAEHMEERIQKADKTRKALIESQKAEIASKKELVRILEEGTTEQKIEILAEKYVCELKNEIEKLNGTESLIL